ncbi:MAG: M1 family aminopeptidase, partial [Algoriphagus sp.]
FCTVLLFSVCLLTKNSLATYAMAVLIYALYFISAIFLNSPLLANASPVASENLFAAALADPFGLSAFFEQTNLWTPFQKNQESISFLGLLGWNRVLWIGISGLLLAFSYAKFSFRSEHSAKRKAKSESQEDRTKVATSIIHAPEAPAICTKRYRPILETLIRQDLRLILKSIAFWGIMGTWLILAITEIYSKISAGGAYNERYFPASQLLLEQIQQPLYLFGILLLIFFSGELVWRARASKFHEILGATPTPNRYFFLSKLISLLILILLIIEVTVLLTLIFHLSQGYLSTDSLALFSLFVYPGISLAFYATLFLLIQNFCKSNYLGMGISGLSFALFSGPLGTALGLNHPLFKIGDLPALIYSEQAGWEMNSSGFWVLALLWIFLIGSSVLFSINNWQGSLARISEKSSWNKYKNAGILGLTAFLTLAGFSFYQINYVEKYQSQAEMLSKKEQYELNYKPYETTALLSYSSLYLKVDLYPSQGTFAATIQGKLKNTSDKIISKILLTEKEELKSISLQYAREISKDEAQGVYIVEFEKPIEVDEELEFSFEVQSQKNIFTSDPAIIRDGTYLNFRDFAPYFGFSEGREISDNQERRKRGLPLKPEKFGPQEHADGIEMNLVKVDFEAEISTDLGQTALTSGDLMDQKTTRDRNIFKFKSTHQIMPAFAFFSGNFHKESLQSENVLLEVYSIPSHQMASNVTLSTMKTSLEILSETFGEYPDTHLKIVEVPSYWGFGGFAHPGVISMVEDNYFLVKPEPKNQFDLQRKRVIHEVAHQWFGHLLAPRNLPGASLFVEGFAKYAEAMVMEKELGKQAIWHLTDNANRTYFSGRAFASEKEPPLSKLESQNYLSYGKSLISLLATQELIGAEKVNSVIRKIVAANRTNPKPAAKISDFLSELNALSSPAEKALIQDWFEKVIHYDIKIHEVNTKLLSNGEYELKVAYSAKKLATLVDGSVQEIAMDEPFTLALLAAHPEDISTESEILSNQKIAIHQGSGEFTLISKVKPQWIGLDPWGTRPDSNRRDNFYQLD